MYIVHTGPYICHLDLFSELDSPPTSLDRFVGPRALINDSAAKLLLLAGQSAPELGLTPREVAEAK